MRALLIAAVSLVILAGLIAWVMFNNQPRQFAVPLDHRRELPQGDFYVSAIPEPQDLNALTSRDAWALGFVIGHTHDCLMRLSPVDGTLESCLARLVEPSTDQLSYLFELRPGIRFSDGSPVDLADVAFTYQVSRVEDVVLGSIADSVRRVQSFESVGERRFRITLKERHFTGLAGFATGYRVVKKQWILARIAQLAAAEGLTGPVDVSHAAFGRLLGLVGLPGPGTGPYALAVDSNGAVMWERGRELWLVQNPHSWHRAAHPRAWNLAGMRLRFIGSTQAIYTELRRERLDWYLPPDLSALLKEDPDLLQRYRRFDYDTPSTGQFFVLWNHQREALSDRRVRRALTMLFDVERIAREVFGGSARVASAWFKPGSMEHSPDLPKIVRDPVAARQLLAEAGYGAGLPHGILKIEIVAAREPRFRRILELAQSAFANAGVELSARIMENSAAKVQRSKGAFDGYMMYWRHSATGVDPHEFFHSNPGGQDGGHNLMHYHNPVVDELLSKAQVEPSAERRRQLYHQFNRLIHDDQPITFFVHPRNTLLLHRRFQAAEPLWAGVTPELFWVAPEQRIHTRGLSGQ